MSHIDSRVEAIDKDLAELEYDRDLSELLTVEARNVLKGSSVVAGDFETVITGIYGDDVEVTNLLYVSSLATFKGNLFGVCFALFFHSQLRIIKAAIFLL